MFTGTLARESVWKKIVILITGYKVTISKLKEKWYIFPMEDVQDGENDLQRKLVVIPSDEGRDKIVERLSNAAQAGKIDTYVWQRQVCQC